ncbi:MAG: hypothetical protein U0746_13200 [Gemmataceae bacterium]
MILPFFSLAMTAPNRHKAFRLAVALHVALVIGASASLLLNPSILPVFGEVLLIAGIVEGALMVGWRLTQLPKCQALEFLLVSPLRPKPLYLAEATVGLSRLALVAISGLPLLLLLGITSRLDWDDIPVLLVMPLTWGAVCGLGLTCWAYESRSVRRVGESLGLAGVVLYLLVGVLAGENLRMWLGWLPEPGRYWFMELYGWFHTYNPFAVMQYWLQSDRSTVIAVERVIGLQIAAFSILGLVAIRGASRLRGHFHDRHYRPLTEVTPADSSAIGDRPLSWWAVRRVMEYSGRVNIWLAGGFGLLYAAYTVAADAWPPWMGRLIFQMVESVGGIPALATGLVVLSAVPACFQYGLWDSSTQDRCRRLELLLLTELTGRDFARAAAAAAWRRGRGYAVIAGLLIVAAVVAGRVTVTNALLASLTGAGLWGLYFALGFRAFSLGRQANGLGSILTLGVPLATVMIVKSRWPWLAALTPPGAIYVALTNGPSPLWWLGVSVRLVAAIRVGRLSIRDCDTNLRNWLDANHGRKGAD